MSRRARTVLFVALPLLAAAAWGQDASGDRKLDFRFRDASVDAVLQYMSGATGWVFVQEKKLTSTVTAVSEASVPLSKCLEFLNSVLRSKGAVILNPFAPKLPPPGTILKVVDAEVARRRSIEIYVGSDPDEVPISDEMRTQIVPLKAINVVDVQKELGDTLRAAVEPDGQLAISTYSNSLILTGRAESIGRLMRILRVIDVSTSAEVRLRVFPLANADATDTARTLNDVFRNETIRGATGMESVMGQFWGGGKKSKGGDPGGGDSTRALARDMVRITAAPRTNAVIVTATDDNLKVIAELIARLDGQGAAAAGLRSFPLRHADATTTAKMLNEIFAESPSTPGGAAPKGGSGKGNKGAVPAGLVGASTGDVTGTTRELRAVAEIRTNSILVVASEPRLQIIAELLPALDQPVNDLVLVKIYTLRNADPVEMTTLLKSLFAPQVGAASAAPAAAAAAVPKKGRGQSTSMAGTSGGGMLLPSQEVEVTNDPRTRSVIVKASREHLSIIDAVVKKLDTDPTESASTYVVRLRSGDAASLSATLQNLLRTQGAGAASQGRLPRQGQPQQPSNPGGGSSGSGNAPRGQQGGSRGYLR
jgi:type II secretory pathway component GspD/PulD (secretin)